MHEEKEHSDLIFFFFFFYKNMCVSKEILKIKRMSIFLENAKKSVWILQTWNQALYMFHMLLNNGNKP